MNGGRTFIIFQMCNDHIAPEAAHLPIVFYGYRSIITKAKLPALAIAHLISFYTS